MIKILQLQGISNRVTILIRMTLEECQVKVVIEKNMTENFNVNVGVGQSDTSVILFNLVRTGLYYIEIIYQGNIATTMVQINA